MPIIESSSYKPPIGFHSGHVQSIYPALFRLIRGVTYHRERIDTPDGDFLDLDWCLQNSDRLLVLTHGLEGNSQGSYILGMGRAFRALGWDILAWNQRGCSGFDNRTVRTYHSGATEDLDKVVRHAIENRHYRSIILIGFSLGGNMTLKYVGERGNDIHPKIKKAIAFSVPADLESSSRSLSRKDNRIYMEHFLISLRKKVAKKRDRFPGILPMNNLKLVQNFGQFDDIYTAPAHGFKDAMDYWRKCSAVRFLSGIRIPTLLINAKNDPFLAAECFPYGPADDNDSFFFESPNHGGHVGFVAFNNRGRYWSESRALEFISGRVFR